MNVLHENGRFYKPLGQGRGIRGRGRRYIPAQLAKNSLPKYRFESGDVKPLVHFAPSTATTVKTPKNRQRFATASSSARKGTLSSNAATTKTPGSSCISDDTNIILAITSGRGDAKTEVGMAMIDLQYPYMILCQISDSQTYIDTLTKIYVFNPVEIIMPDTMCDRQNKLYSSIKERFPGRNVTPVSRFHFNDKAGLDRVQKHCCAEYSSVAVFVKQKYYALAATSALLKYVEYIQHVVYAPKSIKIEFQGSPHCAIIDVESAEKLELVVSQGNDPKICLLGALDHCVTPMGRRLLRVSILQPPCREETIIERQKCVSKLITNSSLCSVIQPVIRRLYGADRLLNMGILHLHTSTVQNAERNLNYVLLLKNCLDVIPELKAALISSESPFFEKVRANLDNPNFELMTDKILKVIHQDARSVMGYTSANMQRCFAIRTGVNDLLDVARRTYCELIEDMKTMVENFSKKYNVPMTLACNATLGYHIQADIFRPQQMNETDFPQEFIQVQRRKNGFTMTTIGLLAMSNQCKMSYDEIHIMSDVMLTNLLVEIKEHIGFLFQLSSDIAELDLIVSLTQVSSMPGFVKPTFGMKLELQESLHPIMKMFRTTSNVVSNNVRASVPYNFHLITGPNMSGKSVYIKQAVLAQIMAQIGCYVLATKAEFRIADRILCRICFHDDIECQASTFTLEMKEAQYILQSVTPNSLLILDEPCRATAIEQGSSIAIGLCEKLFSTTAFIFCATHFVCLNKLADMYFNVTNHCFKVITEEIEGSDTLRILYTYKLVVGDASDQNYGINLSVMSGLPKTISAKAYAIADALHSERNCTDKGGEQRKNNIASLRLRYDLFAAFFFIKTEDKFTYSAAMDLVSQLNIDIMQERENAKNFLKRTEHIARQKNEIATIHSEKSSSQKLSHNTVSTNQKFICKNSDKEVPKIQLENQIQYSVGQFDTNVESMLIGTLKKHMTVTTSKSQFAQESAAEKLNKTMKKRTHKIGKINITNFEFPKVTDSGSTKNSRSISPSFKLTENTSRLNSECHQYHRTLCNFTQPTSSTNNKHLLQSTGSMKKFTRIPSKSDNVEAAESKLLKYLTKSERITSHIQKESPTKKIKTSFKQDKFTHHFNENSNIIEDNAYIQIMEIPINETQGMAIKKFPQSIKPIEKLPVAKEADYFKTKPYINSSILNASWLEERSNLGSTSTSKVPLSSTSENAIPSSDVSSLSYRDLEIRNVPLDVTNKPCAFEKSCPAELDSAKPRSTENIEDLLQRYSSFKNSQQVTTLNDSKMPQSLYQGTCQSLIRVHHSGKTLGYENKQTKNVCKNTFNFTPTNRFQNISRNWFENESFTTMETEKLHDLESDVFKITPIKSCQTRWTDSCESDCKNLFLPQNPALDTSKISLNTSSEELKSSVGIVLPNILSNHSQNKHNNMHKDVFKLDLENTTKDNSQGICEITSNVWTMNKSQNKHLISPHKTFKNSLQSATTISQDMFHNFSQTLYSTSNIALPIEGQCQFQLLSEQNTGNQKTHRDYDTVFDITETPVKDVKKESGLLPTTLNESYVLSPQFFEANISKITTMSDLTFIFENGSVLGQSNLTEIAGYTARAKEMEIFRLIEGDAFDEEQFKDLYNTIQISDEDN